MIHDTGQKARIETQGLERYIIPLPQSTPPRLKRGHANPEQRYTHNAEYYIFRKTHHLLSKSKEEV